MDDHDQATATGGVDQRRKEIVPKAEPDEWFLQSPGDERSLLEMEVGDGQD